MDKGAGMLPHHEGYRNAEEAHAAGQRKRPTTIQGRSGNEVDFLGPAPGSITINDIARGLATCSRFSGQTETFYSVAEHSVLVLDIFNALFPGASLEDRRHAFVHDAHEAYTGDLTTPYKEAVYQICGTDVIREVERRIDAAVFEALGIGQPSDELHADIKRCDWRARFCEGSVLKPKEETFADAQLSVLPPGVRCAFGRDWEDAERRFLLVCHELGIA